MFNKLYVWLNWEPTFFEIDYMCGQSGSHQGVKIKSKGVKRDGLPILYTSTQQPLLFGSEPLWHRGKPKTGTERIGDAMEGIWEYFFKLEKPAWNSANWEWSGSNRQERTKVLLEFDKISHSNRYTLRFKCTILILRFSIPEQI